MLSAATRIRLVVFTVLAVAVIAYTGIHYASLGRLVGLRGYYVVHLELASAGGIFPDAEVDYRGVSVGRVGAAALSAVGAQYVDLRPRTAHGPYLTAGSVIPSRDTVLPLPVTTLLNSVNTLAATLPLGALRTALDNLAAGLNGQGANLQSLIDGNAALV